VKRLVIAVPIALGCLLALSLAITQLGAQPSLAAPAQTGAATETGQRVVAEGRVAAYPGAEVTLGLDLAGTLESIGVEERQAVSKGQVLARLRVDDLRAALAEAQARIAESEADVKLYEIEVERAESLVRSRVESVQNADRARRNLDASRARLATARAAVRRLETEIAKSVLRAPISGVVTQKLIDAGESVRAGEPLITVVDLGRLRVEAEVDEFDASRIRVGASVRVTAEGYDDQRWNGRVEEIPDTVGRRSVRPQDPGKPEDTRVLRVKIALDEKTPLRLGQRVEVEIGG
jgi:HlyD family secretion protein